MRSRIAGALSYANVMATLAVVIALGGTSYAAINLGKGAVKSKNIAKNAVTTAKIKNGAVTAKKLRAGAVTAGAIQAGSLQASDFAAGQLPAKGDAGPPIGPAGGDLSGQYPNPQVNVTLPAASTVTPGVNWTGANTDGEPPLSCYEDREGIVHFVGGLHSNSGAMPVMATLPAGCPAPKADLVIQAMGNLGAMNSTTPFAIPITINTNGTLTQTAGTAGDGTDPHDNLTLESITYRAR